MALLGLLAELLVERALMVRSLLELVDLLHSELVPPLAQVVNFHFVDPFPEIPHVNQMIFE